MCEPALCHTRSRIATIHGVTGRFVIAILVVCSACAMAQECAQVTRDGDQITIVADTWRPLHAVAKTLADRFGILISAEDPDQRSPADLTDRTDKAPAAWKAAHPETRVYDLKRWRLEIRFLAPEHETLHDVPAV